MGQSSLYFYWNLTCSRPYITRVISQTTGASQVLNNWFIRLSWSHYLDHRFWELIQVGSSLITQFTCLSCNLEFARAEFFFFNLITYFLRWFFFPKLSWSFFFKKNIRLPSLPIVFYHFIKIKLVYSTQSRL